MKTKACFALLLCLGAVCAGAVCVGAARPDLGVLIRGPFGDVYYVFPKGQEEIVVNFGGDGAAFGVLTNTSAFNDTLEVVAEGRFFGHQAASVTALEREVTFVDPGSLQSTSDLGSILASFDFRAGSGAFGESFTADMPLGSEYVYVTIDITQTSNMWVTVVNAKPKKVKKPHLKLTGGVTMTQVASAGPTGRGPLQLTIANMGDEDFVGEITGAIGLAYYPGWVPESVATYAMENLGSGTIKCGETATVSVPLPPITAAAMDTFRAQRLLYSDQMDADPERDYIGIVLRCGEDTLFTWIPLGESVPTVAMRKG